MSTPQFDEALHPRESGGKFLARPVADAAGGMAAFTPVTPPRSVLARDRGGLGLVAGDVVRKHDATWEHADLIVLSAQGDRLTVANAAQPSIVFDVNASDMRVDRIDLNSPKLSVHSSERIARDRDHWTGRDPEYVAHAQHVLDTLPLTTVGPKYRRKMLDLVEPSDRLDVAAAPFETYFALRTRREPLAHEQALAAARADAAVPRAVPTKDGLRALSDSELGAHQLAWGVRHSGRARRRIAAIIKERGNR